MEELRTVRVCGTEEEAAVIQGFLQSEGIEAQVQSLLFKQEPVNFGKLGDVRIRVPASDYDRAAELLDAADTFAPEPESDSESEPESET